MKHSIARSMYRPEIEELLHRYRDVLGNDYHKYRNHVYRVFHNCLLHDKRRSQEDRYAIAAVFHDLGIWTDKTIDYLAPSRDLAADYLKSSGRADWVEEVSLMISWHHKIRPYFGPFRLSVENFRKSDWTDVSLGLLTYGLHRRQVMANRLRFPTEGFHLFLLGKILRNFFRHPLHPLPMFRL